MKIKIAFIRQKWFLGFIFAISFCELNAQQLLYPTLSSFSFDNIVSNKMVTYTSGEAITGLKFINQNFIIEGIYVFKEAPDLGTNLLPPSTRSWRVFPNPAKGKFTISNEANISEIEVHIFYLSGIQVKSLFIPASSSIEVLDLAEGIYLIKIIENSALISSSSFVKLIVTN